MNPQHEDELLERLIREEIPPSDPEVRTRLAHDQAFRTKVQEWQEMLSLARVAGERDHEDLERAIGATTAQDRELARRMMPPARSRLRRLAPFLAVAAAAVVVLAIVLRSESDSDTPETPSDRGELLGPDAVQRPVEAVETFPPFRVDRTLQPGEVLRFNVWDAALGQSSEPLLQSEAISSAEWRPEVPPEFTWPPRIVWEARVVHEWTGEEESLGLFEAWITP